MRLGLPLKHFTATDESQESIWVGGQAAQGMSELLAYNGATRILLPRPFQGILEAVVTTSRSRYTVSHHRCSQYPLYGLDCL